MPIFRPELIQNTPEWREWRNGGLGASDAPIVLHESPFKTRYRLWLERTGRVAPEKQSAAMKYGHDSEPFAREQFIRETGIDIVPMCVEYSDAPYIRASLDGWCEKENTVVEIKCPESPRDFRAAREGVIPQYYWIQIQHQLAVAEASKAFYYCWYQGEGVTIPVKPDKRFWFETLLPAEQELWHQIESNEWLEPKDAVRNMDSALRECLRLRIDAETRIAGAERDKLSAEAALKRALGDYKTLTGDGFKATWISYKPRYYVQIEVASQNEIDALMPKLQKLNGHTGVKKIEPKTWAPNLIFRLTETKAGIADSKEDA